MILVKIHQIMQNFRSFNYQWISGYPKEIIQIMILGYVSSPYSISTSYKPDLNLHCKNLSPRNFQGAWF